MIRNTIALVFFVICITNCSPAPEPAPGAEGIGDPYYPQMGNGGYDALHYTLELSVEPESNTVLGLSTMKAQATQSLSAFNLDFLGLTINQVTVDDKPADFSRNETFFQILRTYTERFRHSNASTADFIAVAEEVSGQDLAEFFDAWLYTEVIPEVPEMGLKP